jgi:YfiH family protein
VRRATAARSPGAGGWQPFTLGPGVRAAFTDRTGGVSAPPYDTLNLGFGTGDDPAAVRRNRMLAATACGLDVSRLAWMRQVHGADVCRIDAAQPPGSAPPRADAIFTATPGLAMAVLAADCAPVLIADPVAGLAGAAHAGREGLASGVLPALIEALVRAGGVTARMRAAVGPLICGGCYEVPRQMSDRIAAVVPEAACATRRGTPGIDVLSGVRAQLGRAGVSAVSYDGRCTAETPALYSYRRDGATGRLAGLIWLAS